MPLTIVKTAVPGSSLPKPSLGGTAPITSPIFQPTPNIPRTAQPNATPPLSISSNPLLTNIQNKNPGTSTAPTSTQRSSSDNTETSTSKPSGTSGGGSSGGGGASEQPISTESSTGKKPGNRHLIITLIGGAVVGLIGFLVGRKKEWNLWASTLGGAAIGAGTGWTLAKYVPPFKAEEESGVDGSGNFQVGDKVIASHNAEIIAYKWSGDQRIIYKTKIRKGQMAGSFQEEWIGADPGPVKTSSHDQKKKWIRLLTTLGGNGNIHEAYILSNHVQRPEKIKPKSRKKGHENSGVDGSNDTQEQIVIHL